MPTIHAAVYVDTPFSDKVFDSVPYFDFEDTKWPFMKSSGDMLIGTVRILTGSDFDKFFTEYQTVEKETTVSQDASESTDSDSDAEYSLETNNFISKEPNFLLVEFRGSTYSSSLANIEQVAAWLDMDFVVLVVNRDATWYEKFRFWWSHKLPGASDQLMDAGEVVDWSGRVPCSFLALGPARGAKLINLLEEFETWNLEPSAFYFGIDDASVMQGRTFMWRISLYLVFTTALCRWVLFMDRRERQQKEGEEELVTYTGDELGMGEVQTTSTHECCICLETMEQGETVRILPCRHVFHHECINGWFHHNKYSCPMCKVDLKKHLEERRLATEEINVLSSTPKRSIIHRLWPCKRTILTVSEGQLIEGRTEPAASTLGDLELSEGTGVMA
jgi:Ring finger domain